MFKKKLYKGLTFYFSPISLWLVRFLHFLLPFAKPQFVQITKQGKSISWNFYENFCGSFTIIQAKYATECQNANTQLFTDYSQNLISFYNIWIDNALLFLNLPNFLTILSENIWGGGGGVKNYFLNVRASQSLCIWRFLWFGFLVHIWDASVDHHCQCFALKSCSYWRTSLLGQQSSISSVDGDIWICESLARIRDECFEYCN